jgi:signal recognition particle subunit SRP19
MSRQPRFEEIEDDDDPPELDLPDTDNTSSALLTPIDLPQPSSGGMPKSADEAFKPKMISQQDMEQFKTWSCIYPVYFDASRSLQEGRRVPLHLAVKNPLAKDMAEAAASLGIQSVLEVEVLSRDVTNAPGSLRKFIPRTGRIQVVYGMRLKMN